MKQHTLSSFIIKEPSAAEGKKKIDRIIDICGPAPKGTGLQNLRECIIETKWKYDVAPEEKQIVWKQMILDFMERWEGVWILIVLWKHNKGFYTFY